MQINGVKKQFTKLQALSTILPEEVIEEIKNILIKKESQFENRNAYLLAKTKILQIFRQSEDAAFERAMGRVLSGKPSQLARALINDLCDHELQGCCCYRFIAGLWRRALPSAVKQGIADEPFSADNLDRICKKADKIFESTPRPSQSIAAVKTSTNLDEGFHPGWPSESHTEAHVAAYGFSRGRGQRGGGRGQNSGRGSGSGRGGRGNGRGSGGQNRGGQNQGNQRGGAQGSGSGHPRHKVARHADLPPFESCLRHWQFGKSAHFCMEPVTCPWKDYYIPKSNN